MEGLTNPDKLKTLWEQSKTKKLWDDSQNRSLDQHLLRFAKDSVSIEDYMNRWCNVVQTLNSSTPQEDHRMPQKNSTEKRDNLDKYDKFINKLSVRIEGRWPPADQIPTMKTFCDTLSDSLPESSKTRKPTRLRSKTLIDSHYNPIRTRGQNPTRSRFPQ